MIQTGIIALAERDQFSAQHSVDSVHRGPVLQLRRPTSFHNGVTTFGKAARWQPRTRPFAKYVGSHLIFTAEVLVGSIQYQDLPKDETERVHVDGSIVRLSESDFGSHVSQGPYHMGKVIGRIVVPILIW
jgi:hypothetical protein